VGLQHQDLDVLPTTWSGRELLETGALARIPSHGIGRSMKAGKEEIVGLLVALERYLARDEAAEIARWRRLADELTAGLSEIDGLETWTEPVSPPDRPVARTAIRVDASAYGRSATEIVQAFERRDPIIMLADHASADGVLRLDVENLRDDEVAPIVDAFAELAATPASAPHGAPAARPG
jgi:L-seryl-tRNA(Ser) seleniumtransferase